MAWPTCQEEPRKPKLCSSALATPSPHSPPPDLCRRGNLQAIDQQGRCGKGALAAAGMPGVSSLVVRGELAHTHSKLSALPFACRRKRGRSRLWHSLT